MLAINDRIANRVQQRCADLKTIIIRILCKNTYSNSHHFSGLYLYAIDWRHRSINLSPLNCVIVAQLEVSMQSVEMGHNLRFYGSVLFEFSKSLRSIRFRIVV